MRESFRTVRQMGMAYITVGMEHSLMVNLEMGKNMELEHILYLMENQGWVNGKMAQEFNGFIKIRKYEIVYFFATIVIFYFYYRI